MAKTTVEDTAREAGVSRATVYRHFPGGRDQLLQEAIAWQVQVFFLELAAAVHDQPDFSGVLCEGLHHAHRAVAEHEVLQRLLSSEPGRLLPLITTEAERLLPLIASFFRPYLEKEVLRPGIDVAQASEYVARMVVSHINAQGTWNLDDRAQVKELVELEFLSGVTEVTARQA
jgi:AcrR family transcriptional regulator